VSLDDMKNDGLLFGSENHIESNPGIGEIQLIHAIVIGTKWQIDWHQKVAASTLWTRTPRGFSEVGLSSSA
jgi:hypothetical protein